MRGELDFQKYTQLLGEGLFADNVILSIIGYRENGVLGTKEKEVLKRAFEFFDNVIDGERLQSSVISSAHDVNAAKAYNSVQPIRVRLSQLCALRNTIEEMLNNNPVNKQEINQLDNFFSSFSRIKYQKAKTVLETV